MSDVKPISMFHLWHSCEIRRNLQIPANSQSHWGIGLISIWWLSSSLIFLLPRRLEQTMFRILFPSALWVWVHNKGNWMSDSTVLKLWKNNPDLKLCFSFQLIQKSWAPYITEATVCWPESLRSESVILLFEELFCEPVRRWHLYFSEVKEAGVSFRVAGCVCMLSVSPMPTGVDADKSQPACVFIISERFPSAVFT